MIKSVSQRSRLHTVTPLRGNTQFCIFSYVKEFLTRRHLGGYRVLFAFRATGCPPVPCIYLCGAGKTTDAVFGCSRQTSTVLRAWVDRLKPWRLCGLVGCAMLKNVADFRHNKGANINWIVQ